MDVNNLTVVNPEELSAKEWRALDLTVAGATLKVIAVDLGYASRSGALQCQRRALRKYSRAVGDDLNEWHARVVGGLQNSLEKIASKVANGDLDEIKVHHDIMKTFISIHGLKAPEKLEARIGIAYVELTDAERTEQLFTLLATGHANGAGPGDERPEDESPLDATSG